MLNFNFHVCTWNLCTVKNFKSQSTKNVHKDTIVFQMFYNVVENIKQE